MVMGYRLVEEKNEAVFKNGLSMRQLTLQGDLS